MFKLIYVYVIVVVYTIYKDWINQELAISLTTMSTIKAYCCSRIVNLAMPTYIYLDSNMFTFVIAIYN